MNKITKVGEAVLFGHPDKLADSISDAILDAILAQDPQGRVAVETLVTGNHVVVAGEISAKGSNLNVEELVRQAAAQAGYLNAELGFDAFSCKITNLLQRQSPELSNLQKDKVVAGDQGIMTGYATAESPDFLPLQVAVARQALRSLASQTLLPEIYTDAKALAQVSFLPNSKFGDSDFELPRLESLVISVHNHLPNFSKYASRLGAFILEQLRGRFFNYLAISDDFAITFNPGGPFTIGGPSGDTGLTGRKIVADQYGDEVPIGGGAFSGKDPSKVDRSASLYARYVALNLVASGMCSKALIRVSYVIGQENPRTVTLDTLGTNVSGLSDEELLKTLLAKGVFNFSVSNIITELGLRNPIYFPAGQLGPFGINPEYRPVLVQVRPDLWEPKDILFFPWEQINKTKAIQKVLD